MAPKQKTSNLRLLWESQGAFPVSASSLSLTSYRACPLRLASAPCAETVPNTCKFNGFLLTDQEKTIAENKRAITQPKQAQENRAGTFMNW